MVGRSFDDMEHLQAVSDEELEWINARLPSRGRACNGRPPLVAYPDAEYPRRTYKCKQEFPLFSMQRVYHYLADRYWWRRVNRVGQISLGGQRYSVGSGYAREDVKITFDAEAAEFVVHNTHDKPITRLAPKNLSVETITGRSLS